MLYIPNDSHNPYFNLALEEYVLKRLNHEAGYILLWQNEPSVIIGRFQNTIEEINQQFVQENQIHVVRRITGGGAVYHDLGNLNFSFIIQDQDKNIEFRRFTEPIVKALGKAGIHAVHTGRNDITIDNKKFSGNAQYHYKNRTLHHGTILFDSRLEDVQAALNVKLEKIESKGVKSVRSRVTNVIDYLDHKISVQVFRDLLLYHLFEEHPIEEYILTEEDQRSIRRLMEEKYLTWEWNYGQAPSYNLTKKGRSGFGGIEFKLDVQKGIIADCKIFGDFFSNKDINELEKQLRGVKYQEEELASFIKTTNADRYFSGFTQEELLRCLID